MHITVHGGLKLKIVLDVCILIYNYLVLGLYELNGDGKRFDTK